MSRSGAQVVVELDLKSTPMAARANAVVRQGLSRAVVTLHVLRPPHGEMHDASVHSPLAPPVARTVQGSRRMRPTARVCRRRRSGCLQTESHYLGAPSYGTLSALPTTGLNPITWVFHPLDLGLSPIRWVLHPTCYASCRTESHLVGVPSVLLCRIFPKLHLSKIMPHPIQKLYPPKSTSRHLTLHFVMFRSVAQ